MPCCSVTSMASFWGRCPRRRQLDNSAARKDSLPLHSSSQVRTAQCPSPNFDASVGSTCENKSPLVSLHWWCVRDLPYSVSVSSSGSEPSAGLSASSQAAPGYPAQSISARRGEVGLYWGPAALSLHRGRGWQRHRGASLHKPIEGDEHVRASQSQRKKEEPLKPLPLPSTRTLLRAGRLLTSAGAASRGGHLLPELVEAPRGRRRRPRGCSSGSGPKRCSAAVSAATPSGRPVRLGRTPEPAARGHQGGLASATISPVSHSDGCDGRWREKLPLACRGSAEAMGLPWRALDWPCRSTSIDPLLHEKPFGWPSARLGL